MANAGLIVSAMPPAIRAARAFTAWVGTVNPITRPRISAVECASSLLLLVARKIYWLAPMIMMNGAANQKSGKPVDKKPTSPIPTSIRP